MGGSYDNRESSSYAVLGSSKFGYSLVNGASIRQESAHQLAFSDE